MLKLIVSNLQPLAITEDTNFQDFVKALKPTVSIPNTSLMRLELLGVYEEEKMAVRRSLDAADDVVLTCELWCSRAEDHYLTVRCHVVDKYGKLRSYMLETTSIFGDNSAGNIKNQLSGIMEAWGIREKVHTVVTAGMPQQREFKAKWILQPCFSYTLNMIFSKLLECDKGLKEFLRKCKDIVRFFKSDAEAEQKLREFRNQLKLPEEELIMHTREGWLTLLPMLEQFDRQYMAMLLVFDQKGSDHFILTEKDKIKMKNVISALKPLSEATSMLKREGFDTISVIIPLLKKLVGDLKKEEREGNKTAALLLSKCEECFGDVNNHKLALITALDPRFKNLLEEQEKQWVMKKIIQELSTVEPASSTAPNYKQLLDDYMASEPLPEGGNPLAWWKFTGSKKFKGISKFAVKKLGTVSTAVPLDRAFSAAEDRFCCLRSCLEPENLNMILFLNSNWDTRS